MILTFDTTFFLQHYFESDTETHAKTRRTLVVCRKPGNKGIVPSIVLGEFYAETHRKLGREVAEKNFREIVDSGLIVESLDAETAREAARLRRRYQEKIPWGDCIIAASGVLADTDFIVSEDPHFQEIREVKARRLAELPL